MKDHGVAQKLAPDFRQRRRRRLPTSNKIVIESLDGGLKGDNVNRIVSINAAL